MYFKLLELLENVCVLAGIGGLSPLLSFHSSFGGGRCCFFYFFYNLVWAINCEAKIFLFLYSHNLKAGESSDSSNMFFFNCLAN